jgi:hypothetical protein
LYRINIIGHADDNLILSSSSARRKSYTLDFKIQSLIPFRLTNKQIAIGLKVPLSTIQRKN